jgi:hypothetical protein
MPTTSPAAATAARPVNLTWVDDHRTTVSFDPPPEVEASFKMTLAANLEEVEFVEANGSPFSTVVAADPRRTAAEARARGALTPEQFLGTPDA